MSTESVVYAFLFAVALLISLTIHEAAHAYTAVWLGDPTPAEGGRQTLNPLSHLAPMGFALPVIAVLLSFPFLFGWGKPVEINPARLRSPRWGQLTVAISGPFSNAILCMLTCFIAALSVVKFGLEKQSWISEAFSLMIYLNAILAIFNILPLPPLDGSAILRNLLPMPARNFFEDYIAPYGFFLFLALLFSGKINFIFTGAIAASEWFYQKCVLLLGTSAVY